MDLHALGREAVALHQQGQLAQAEARYRQILAADARVFPALYLLGVLCLQAGDTAEAADLIGRALAISPNDPAALMHYGLALHGKALFGKAAAAYDRLLALQPGLPAALMGRGAALRALGRLDAALADHESVLTADARNPDAWNGRGALLRNLRRIDEALDSFNQAIALRPDFTEALNNRGDLHWSERLDYDAAVADLSAALALEPDRPWLRGNLLHLKMFGADWTDFDRQAAAIDVGVRAGTAVVHPFIYQALSHSPADLQACSRIYATPADAPVWRPRQHAKIRLGYVSGELRAHAISHLMAELFERHDRDRFEVIAVDYAGGDGSAMRARLEKRFDRILHIGALDDAAAAQAIAGAEIDILINLNGYFGAPRNGIFAGRPAPIQVSYMGFPATMGAPYMDYVIADRTVVPQDEARFYDEKIAWLPDTYWVLDMHGQTAASPSRAAAGLPDGAFVFCNFNNAYKLTPATFAGWMRILQQVPRSVLWLFAGNNPRFAENLRRQAVAAGVDAVRLIFAPLAPTPQHLARLKLADLLLDSLPYNAHTTASDMLLAGVPVLTCRGTTWPGRVAASLLQAAGLPELITDTQADYEALAVAVARDPARLAALKQKLAVNRISAPLFDTARFARNMERAYEAMWARHLAGEAPAAISV